MNPEKRHGILDESPRSDTFTRMRRLLTLLFVLLPLAPLAFALLQTQTFLKTSAEEQIAGQSRFILEATAGIFEPVLSRPTLSRTELFEVGRRVDGLGEVESVFLLYRSPSEARLPKFDLAYATPGRGLSESSEYDALLAPLVVAAQRKADESVGDITRRLGELGVEIVNLVVEGRSDESSNLERLDREFKLLYEEGNERLIEVSRSLQQVVEVPSGRPGAPPEDYLAQPVLSFSRSRSVEVLGVILLKTAKAAPEAAGVAFLRRLAGTLLVAYTLFLVGLFVSRWQRRTSNCV